MMFKNGAEVTSLSIQLPLLLLLLLVRGHLTSGYFFYLP